MKFFAGCDEFSRNVIPEEEELTLRKRSAAGRFSVSAILTTHNVIPYLSMYTTICTAAFYINLSERTDELCR